MLTWMITCDLWQGAYRWFRRWPECCEQCYCWGDAGHGCWICWWISIRYVSYFLSFIISPSNNNLSDREPTDGSGGEHNFVSSLTAEEMQAMAAEYADGYPSGMYLISYHSLSLLLSIIWVLVTGSLRMVPEVARMLWVV